MTAPVGDIPTASLRWALSAVLPAVGTDPMRPNLCTVRVECAPPEAPGALWLITTDGHRLHRAEIHASGLAAGGAWSAQWDAAACAAVLRALPRGKRAPPMTQVARREDGGIRVQAGASWLEIPAADCPRYPDWRQVVAPPVPPHDAPPTPWGGVAGVDPTYVAAACAACPGESCKIHLAADPLHPIHVTSTAPGVGVFFALVMPMRV